tara:strand:+ start:623 stop:967 length:345 start_codon:yes stop_codon:yes gene_type:complete
MAHFAKIDSNNIVKQVEVVSNDVAIAEKEGIDFLKQTHGDRFTWVQTSYNCNFRKQFAGVNFVYDEANDIFIAPQPYPSWSLDSNHDWQPPIPYPDDGRQYTWDEVTQWDVING